MTSNMILPEFQDFLLSHRLVAEKNAPYYARWVSRFLAFSNKSRDLDHDTLTSEFMHSLKSEENIADWQVLQAEGALRLYLYHFKGADVLKEARGVARAGKGLWDCPRLLGEIRSGKIRRHHISAKAIQELFGHKNLQTTMVYTHIASKNILGVRSPLDR
jgi:hypothetical protein